MNRKAIVVTVTALLVVALVGCGSSSDSDSKSSGTSPSTPSTSTKDAVCADKDALAASVKTLVDPDTLTGGKSAISAAAKQVQADLDNLGESVDADLEPQVSEVKTAIEGVDTAIGDVGNGDVSDNLEKIGTAIANVGTAVADLASAVATRCPTS